MNIFVEGDRETSGRIVFAAAEYLGNSGLFHNMAGAPPPDSPRAGTFRPAAYYRTDDFRTDFADFMRTHRAGKTAAVKALLDYEDALGRSEAADTRAVPAGDLLPPGANLVPNDMPVRRNRILVFELAYDIQLIVDALKLQKKPVQSRDRYFYVTRPLSAASARIDQISNWMAYLLRLCDGRRSVDAIVRQLSARLPEIQKSFREYVCMRLLQGAENEQFIEVYRTARDSVAPNRKPAAKLNARRAA